MQLITQTSILFSADNFSGTLYLEVTKVRGMLSNRKSQDNIPKDEIVKHLTCRLKMHLWKLFPFTNFCIFNFACALALSNILKLSRTVNMLFLSLHQSRNHPISASNFTKQLSRTLTEKTSTVHQHKPPYFSN